MKSRGSREKVGAFFAAPLPRISFSFFTLYRKVGKVGKYIKTLGRFIKRNVGESEKNHLSYYLQLSGYLLSRLGRIWNAYFLPYVTLISLAIAVGSLTVGAGQGAQIDLWRLNPVQIFRG